MNILAALESASMTDLAVVTSEIEKTRKKLSDLVAVANLLRTRLGVGQSETVSGSHRTGTLSATALKAAKYILLEGPQIPAALARAIGLSSGGVLQKLKQHPWFEREGDGRLNLTAEGRIAAGGKS
jgi:hypothetical protein